MGALAREGLVALRWIFGGGKGPRLVILPSHNRAVGSSNLRAYLMVPALAGRGWRTALLPEHLSLAQRRRLLRLIKPDLLLVQKSRHRFNRVEHLPETPRVFDIDDADFLDPARHDEIAALMRSAALVVAGSRYIADWCRPMNRHVEIVWTGTPASPRPLRPHGERGRIIAWASSSPSGYPREAAFMLEVMRALLPKAEPFTLRIYGDDGSPAFADMVTQARADGATVETLPYLPYARFLETLDGVAVGLNPLVDLDGFSAGKSFGKVLGYLDRGVPVVSHAAGDYPLFFESGRNGYLVESAADWAEAIAALLEQPPLRQSVADAAHADFLARLSTDAVADRLDRVLRSLLPPVQQRTQP